MCVIVLHTEEENTYLTKAQFSRLWDRNPHGGGLSFINDSGEIETHKTMEKNEFWQIYRNYTVGLRSRFFLVHMRIATHGEVKKENVHPFPLGEDLVMAHNGVINGVRTNKDRSDSRAFLEDVVAHLPATWLDDEPLVEFVEDAIGGSKLAFLTTNPDLEYPAYILNAKKGSWRGETWFSNTYALDPPQEKPKSWSSKVTYYKKNGTVVQGGVAQLGSGSKEFQKATGEATVFNGKSEYEQRMDALEKAVEDGLTGGNYASNAKWMDIRKERNERGYPRAFTLANYEETKPGHWEPVFECFGCREQFDAEDPTCMCYEKLCLKCDNVAIECRCFNQADLVLFEDIPDDYQPKQEALDMEALYAWTGEGSEDYAWLMD